MRSLLNCKFFEGYDGPLQYTMDNDNPDQVISILPISSDYTDGGKSCFTYFAMYNTENSYLLLQNINWACYSQLPLIGRSGKIF